MTFNWGVGVLLSMPIFDGLRTDKAKDEAESKAEAAHQGSEELRRNITAQVLQALQDVSASHAQASNTRAQLEQAQEDINMTKIQYDLGAGTNADYLDSLEILSSTKIDDFNAQLKEAQSGLTLHEMIGDKMPLGGA
jgi:outer membrane protein TolC